MMCYSVSIKTKKTTIREIDGRYTCTACGREWSAMCSEDSIPEKCDCQNKKETMNNIFDEFQGDGSHCGLTDLYPEHTKALIKALNAGKPFTTGWWSSKKECASAKMDFDGKETLTISVSVSDDFDTEGMSTGTITVTKEDLKGAGVDSPIMQEISDCIYDVWDESNENQKENRTWAMYCIGNQSCGKRVNWIETYLVNVDGWEQHPPGDNYGKWGYQGENKLPADVKKSLSRGMRNLAKRVTSKGFVAELVD